MRSRARCRGDTCSRRRSACGELRQRSAGRAAPAAPQAGCRTSSRRNDSKDAIARIGTPEPSRLSSSSKRLSFWRIENLELLVETVPQFVLPLAGEARRAQNHDTTDAQPRFQFEIDNRGFDGLAKPDF